MVNFREKFSRRNMIRWAGILFLSFVIYEVVSWPDVPALAKENPTKTAFIRRYQCRQWLRGKEPKVQWKWVSYSRISPWLKRAVVVAEDGRFFSHEGFDREELRKAWQDAWEDRELPRGASTITQQTAKNLWLSPSRNPLRKIKEAVLAWELERYLKKRRILEIYLNVAEFGPGIYGAEAAARHYFHKSASELSDYESAQLAASLPMPRKWHPGVKSKSYWRYVNTVSRRLAKSGYLNGRI